MWQSQPHKINPYMPSCRLSFSPPRRKPWGSFGVQVRADRSLGVQVRAERSLGVQVGERGSGEAGQGGGGPRGLHDAGDVFVSGGRVGGETESGDVRDGGGTDQGGGREGDVVSPGIEREGGESTTGDERERREAEVGAGREEGVAAAEGGSQEGATATGGGREGRGREGTGEPAFVFFRPGVLPGGVPNTPAVTLTHQHGNRQLGGSGLWCPGALWL